ncbi:hypothetical protein NL676_008744 [Syzygium grande]|nr:hypothetical protein NL676_008744 [Syzygium grande]
MRDALSWPTAALGVAAAMATRVRAEPARPSADNRKAGVGSSGSDSPDRPTRIGFYPTRILTRPDLTLTDRSTVG